MNNKYWKVEISFDESLSDHEKEELSAGFINEDCYGTQLKEQSIEFFFSESVPSADLEEIFKDFNPQITLHDSEDWTQSCQEIMQEVEVGGIRIRPLPTSNDKPLQYNENDLFIIPGMGFGSGHHPTTQMITEFIQELELKPNQILDFGTGSGILAVAAKRIFPEADILALDSDPQALINAQDNIELNGYSDGIKLQQVDLSQITGKFDLILANIYLKVLSDYKDHISKRQKSSGFLIISGIKTEETDIIKQEFSNYDCIKEQNRDGWAALLFQVKS